MFQTSSSKDLPMYCQGKPKRIPLLLFFAVFPAINEDYKFVHTKKHVNFANLEMKQTDFPPLTYNGQVQKLTWPQVTDRKKKSEIYKFWVPMVLWHPASFKRLGHLLWLRHGDKDAKKWFEVRSFQVTWPLKIGGQKLHIIRKIGVGIVIQNFAAIRAAVFSLLTKNLRGADIRPPPPCRCAGQELKRKCISKKILVILHFLVPQTGVTMIGGMTMITN